MAAARGEIAAQEAALAEAQRRQAAREAEAEARKKEQVGAAAVCSFLLLGLRSLPCCSHIVAVL